MAQNYAPGSSEEMCLAGHPCVTDPRGGDGPVTQNLPQASQQPLQQGMGSHLELQHQIAGNHWDFHTIFLPTRPQNAGAPSWSLLAISMAVLLCLLW